MRSKHIAFLVLSSVTAAHAQGYESASRYETSYKCEAEKAGGFSHSKSGSKLVNFELSQDFFITHISNLPTDGYNDWPAFRGIEDESALKTAFEANVHVKMTHQEGVWTEETGTYYFREASTNPRSDSHALDICTIGEVSGPGNPAIIRCKSLLGGQTMFNVDTSRFTRVK